MLCLLSACKKNNTGASGAIPTSSTSKNEIELIDGCGYNHNKYMLYPAYAIYSPNIGATTIQLSSIPTLPDGTVTTMFYENKPGKYRIDSTSLNNFMQILLPDKIYTCDLFSYNLSADSAYIEVIKYGPVGGLIEGSFYGRFRGIVKTPNVHRVYFNVTANFSLIRGADL